MNILATAPQRFTRPPKKAVRPLAVAFLVLLPFLSFADFAYGDSQNLNAVKERLVELNTKAYTANERLQAITGYSYDIKHELEYNVSPYVQSIQSLLYSSLPTVADALGSVKDNTDLSTEYLRLIKEGLLNERVTILSNIETYLLGLSQKADDVYDSSTHSIRVSSDPRVSVTNRIEVYSPSLSNQIERLIGHSAFNTNYNPRNYSYPVSASKFFIWQVSGATSEKSAFDQRSLVGLGFPTLTGDFLTDAITVLRYQAHVSTSVSLSGIRTVRMLDGISNVLHNTYLDNSNFHRANTNLLESIRSQDEDEYAAMDDFRSRILAWIDDQQERQDAADDKSEELLSEVEGYEPQAGSAPDQSFKDEDLSSRVEGFDSLVSVLQSRDCPQSLSIHFGGWHLFGSQVEDDPIEIPLQSARSVFDVLRTGFSLLWWGLSALVMWWLVRLLVQLHHKIITWTFTTTSGPQS